MIINIVMLDGSSHTMTVNPQDTVGSLKTLIKDKLGVPPHRQRLMFVNGHNTALNDDTKPISFYGLQSGSQVSLLVTQPPPPIEVFLRNEGKVKTYHITPEETVSNFKLKVEKGEGVQVSQQRLLHQSRDMEDGRLLSDYGVTKHSTIDLRMRLRGGQRSPLLNISES